jgi:hypothetical protein
MMSFIPPLINAELNISISHLEGLEIPVSGERLGVVDDISAVNMEFKITGVGSKQLIADPETPANLLISWTPTECKRILSTGSDFYLIDNSSPQKAVLWEGLIFRRLNAS